MGVRGLFFNGLFGVCCLLTLAEPFAGIVAYVVHYHTGPESTYWGRPLADAGVRYSFTISALLAAGTLLNLKRLPYGRLVTRQEALLLAFIGWVLLMGLLMPMQAASFRGVVLSSTDPTDKMPKMAVFLLAMTHVVVTPRRFNQLTWLLVACAFYLGYEAYTAPPSWFFKGRLEGVGGADFSNANLLAAHMVTLLPIVGIRYLRGGWKGKVLCFIAAGLAANTVVLTRSRGGFLAIGAGIVAALILAPKGGRKRVWPLVILGALGSLTLTDAAYMERMETLDAEGRESDGSVRSRLEIWGGGLRMAASNPLGVGPGNFHARIGDYLPEHEGRDAHNSYVRCMGELGWIGLALFVGMILNAFATLSRIRREAAGRHGLEDYDWIGFALQVSLTSYLVSSTFSTTLYTEMMWWILLLPAALERVAANAAAAEGARWSVPPED